MGSMRSITPLVPVSDLDRSVAFFEDVLGFAAGARMEGYAYLRRDGVALRLIDAGPGVDLTDPARQLSCYVDVDDVDALYAELKPKLDALPPGRVRAPFNQEYGQREFHVIDPDALLIFFGAPIPG